MNRARWIATGLVAALALAGCNTIGGVGRDVKSAGSTIERSSGH